MKKAGTCLLVFLCLTLFAACGQEPVAYTPLEQLPTDYTVEQAEVDGCVVHENSNIRSGQERWERFLKDVEKGKAATVRLADYYVLLDPSRYGAEYYKSIKDDYPKLYVKDLTYDGTQYTVRWFEEGTEYVRAYQYLMRYEGEAPGKSASFDSYLRYVLTNDSTVTWEEIFGGMVSSQFGAWIDHCEVYTELIGGEK